jgi:polar amino acid transport system permease protein
MTANVTAVKTGVHGGSAPWHRRYEFLLPLLGLIVAFGLFLLPGRSRPSPGQWVLIVLFGLSALAWAALVVSDNQKPKWFSGAAAAGTIATLGLLFYRYSNARWEAMGQSFFNFSLIRDAWPMILSGLGNTLTLAAYAAVASILIGLVLAVIRSFRNPILNIFIIAYIDFFRSIPLIVLMVVIYYALPFLGIALGPYAAGVVSLSLVFSCFEAEAFRAGIESIHRGQLEAARALGLSAFKTMRLVILPQAIRVVIPPVTGDMVGLLKGTAVASVIALPELLKRGQEVMVWKSSPTPLIAVTLIYLVILLPFIRLTMILERRMKRWVKKSR